MSGFTVGDGVANFAIDGKSEIQKRTEKRTVNGLPVKMDLSIGNLSLSGQYYPDLFILEVDYSESAKEIRSRMGSKAGDQYVRNAAEEARKLAEKHCNENDLTVIKRFQIEPRLKYMIKKK